MNILILWGFLLKNFEEDQVNDDKDLAVGNGRNKVHEGGTEDSNHRISRKMNVRTSLSLWIYKDGVTFE